MPADHAQTDQLELIQQQVDKLTQECARLTAAYAWARRVRMFLALAVIIFVFGVCFAFYRFGTKLMSEEYKQELSKAAEARLEKNQKQYMHQVEMLVDHTSPAISEAFSQRASKDMPAFMKLLEQERDATAKEMETKLSKRLQARYDATLDRHDKILVEEIPITKKPELHDKMSKNMKTAVEHLLNKYYVGELERQLNLLFEAWDRFPVADAPLAGQPTLEEEFLRKSVRVLAIKLGESPGTTRP
jgi:multidrug efflux pump subunit AcrB